MNPDAETEALPRYKDKRTARFAAGERVREWRVCFEWPDDHDKPFNIEITDYH